MNLKKLETLCNSGRYANIEDIEVMSRMSVGREVIVVWSRLPKKHNSWKFIFYAIDMRNAIKNELKET